MAVKTTCDQCGGDNAVRITANFCWSKALPKVVLPQIDIDLCQACAERATAIVNAAFPAKTR